MRDAITLTNSEFKDIDTASHEPDGSESRFRGGCLFRCNYFIFFWISLFLDFLSGSVSPTLF